MATKTSGVLVRKRRTPAVFSYRQLLCALVLLSAAIDGLAFDYSQDDGDQTISYIEELFARMRRQDVLHTSTLTHHIQPREIIITRHALWTPRRHRLSFNISSLAHDSDISRAQVVAVTPAGRRPCSAGFKRYRRAAKRLPCKDNEYNFRNLAIVDVTSRLKRRVGRKTFRVYVKHVNRVRNTYRDKDLKQAMLVVFLNVDTKILLDENQEISYRAIHLKKREAEGGTDDDLDHLGYDYDYSQPPLVDLQSAQANLHLASDIFQPVQASFQPASDNFQPAQANFQPASDNFQPAQANFQPALPVPQKRGPKIPNGSSVTRRSRRGGESSAPEGSEYSPARELVDHVGEVRKKRAWLDAHHRIQYPKGTPTTKPTSTTMAPYVPSKDSCQLKDLQILPGEDLNMGDFISPRVLDIKMCAGQCSPVVLGGPEGGQSWYSYIIKRRFQHPSGMTKTAREVVPQPCCRPVKFQAFTVLRFDGDSDDQVIERWHNARVVECGCEV